jgi:hypothetical protein
MSEDERSEAADPRPPFVRQVSNRVYPAGRRDASPPAPAPTPRPACPACGLEQRPVPRSSGRFATAPRQTCLNPECLAELRLDDDRWTLAGAPPP